MPGNGRGVLFLQLGVAKQNYRLFGLWTINMDGTCGST